MHERTKDISRPKLLCASGGDVGEGDSGGNENVTTATAIKLVMMVILMVVIVVL